MKSIEGRPVPVRERPKKKKRYQLTCVQKNSLNKKSINTWVHVDEDFIHIKEETRKGGYEVSTIECEVLCENLINITYRHKVQPMITTLRILGLCLGMYMMISLLGNFEGTRDQLIGQILTVLAVMVGWYIMGTVEDKQHMLVLQTCEGKELVLYYWKHDRVKISKLEEEIRKRAIHMKASGN